MEKSGRGFIAGTYRPQMSKRRKRGQRRIVNNCGAMVEQVRQVLKKTRDEEMNRSNDDALKVDQHTHTVFQSSKVETFQFNRGRPAVDKQEKRRVKRNLFGEKEGGGGRRSSVNRKLRAQLKAKKKLFKSNHDPYRGRKLESRHVEMTDSTSPWVSFNHLKPCSSCPFKLPVDSSPSLFLSDEEKTRSSAWISLTPSPSLDIVQGVSDDQNLLHEYSPSFFQPSPPAVSLAEWRESLTEGCSPGPARCCPSPLRLEYMTPLGLSHDQSFSSNMSFQDNKLFSSSYSNIEDTSAFNTYVSSYPADITINWALENNELVDASSPVRNMEVRVMWGDVGINDGMFVRK